METKKRKVCVTGSSGLVGSAAVKLFKEKGWEVYGVDANMRHQFFGTPEKESEYNLDIRAGFLVEDFFLDHGPFDAVIHAAAQPSHDYSKDHVFEDFETNARGTLNLLECARHHSPKAVFVHVSTDKVYGDGMKGNTPFDESTSFAPPYSPFGVSKLCSDLYAQEYGAQGWLVTGIFRPGCITGRAHEGAELHGFLAYLAKCVREGRKYRIFGYEGKQVRDQIHAHDLANVFYHFIENPRSGEVYNIGGGPDRSISPLEAIAWFEKKFNTKADVQVLPEPRFGDREWDVHDITKFKSHYPNWDYQFSLENILLDLCTEKS